MRKRPIKARPGELRAAFAPEHLGENGDVIVAWGDGCSLADGNLLLHMLCGKHYPPGGFEPDPKFTDELKRRGYDITTLEFKIQKLKPPDMQATKNPQ